MTDSWTRRVIKLLEKRQGMGREAGRALSSDGSTQHFSMLAYCNIENAFIFFLCIIQVKSENSADETNVGIKTDHTN